MAGHYKIIKDPDLACELRDAGLLWWVSKANGGEESGIYHIPVCVGYKTIRDNIHRGCFGIYLEE